MYKKETLKSQQNLVAKAKEGDIGAIKLILERTVPALRPADTSTPLNLPVDVGLADQGRAVMAALAAGHLPVSQATIILQALSGLARLVEVDELTRRIENLEGKPS